MTSPRRVRDFVVGPIDPATKRGLRGSKIVCRLAGELRRQEVQLVALSASPNSASTIGEPWKLLVSRMSAPASR